jgi:hypothetical protein
VIGTEYVGGLVGWNTGAISDCYSTGSGSGDNYVGGLVGVNYDTVSNSYSTGSATGGLNVSGVVGRDYDGSVNVGGLVGRNYYDGAVSGSFWDTETTGQVASDGGTGKTTAQMQDIATFTGAAWDIITVAHEDTNPDYTWNIVGGVTYPFLSWQD